MRVALYLRCSTDRQDVENQARQLREFASRQSWTIVAEYADYESGSKGDRPQFSQMFADAAKRRFDLVLFWALDRLSREGVLPTLQHLQRLSDCGVQWQSYTESFFASCGPFKDAVISILAVLAKQERVKRSERTRAGLQRVKASGRRLGRPLLKVDCTQVAMLKNQGNSNRAIARMLNVSEATIRGCAKKVSKTDAVSAVFAESVLAEVSA